MTSPQSPNTNEQLWSQNDKDFVHIAWLLHKHKVANKDLLKELYEFIRSARTPIPDDLKKDKERLDWLEMSKCHPWYNSIKGCWVVQKLEQVVGVMGKGSTIRQAIDNAIIK